MSSMQKSIVKQATQHFRKGDYQRAKACYQQAAERYGNQFFEANILLCDKRQNGTGNAGGAVFNKNNNNLEETNFDEILKDLKLIS